MITSDLGVAFRTCSIRPGMTLCWMPFVGMLMIPGRQCRYALATMSGRSLRRVGSPPLNVNQYGAWPSDSKTRSHSGSVRSSLGSSHTLQVLHRELQR